VANVLSITLKRSIASLPGDEITLISIMLSSGLDGVSKKISPFVFLFTSDDIFWNVSWGRRPNPAAALLQYLIKEPFEPP